MKFDAEQEVENIVKFIRNYYAEHGLFGAVVGLSGGKDSAVALALAVRALGSENVVALTLPCHSKEEDRVLANQVAEHYKVSCYNVDLTGTFDELDRAIVKEFKPASEDCLKDSRINAKPRLRMAALYYFAAMLSRAHSKPYLVLGTSNKCELYVGYFTKGGDNVCDISVLADYSVREVIMLGEELLVPKQVLYRAPSDGISGLSDEDKLGVKYGEIEQYMEDPNSVNEQVGKRIKDLHTANLHKFNLPTYRRDKR